MNEGYKIGFFFFVCVFFMLFRVFYIFILYMCISLGCFSLFKYFFPRLYVFSLSKHQTPRFTHCFVKLRNSARAKLRLNESPKLVCELELPRWRSKLCPELRRTWRDEAKLWARKKGLLLANRGEGHVGSECGIISESWEKWKRKMVIWGSRVNLTTMLSMRIHLANDLYGQVSEIRKVHRW